MNFKKFPVVIFIVLALLLVSTTSAFARPELAEFTIQNRSGYTSYIYMNGAGGEFYYLTVPAGTSKTFTVERVAYTYTLNTCNGASADDSIDLTNGGRLVVPATCEMPSPFDQTLFARPQLARFTVNNLSDQTAYLYMYGAGGQYYYFAVAAGTSMTYTVDRAAYTYDQRSCGVLSEDNTVNLANGGSVDIAACPRLVGFSVYNFTDNTLFFTMTGPQTVSFSLDSDTFRFLTVEPGLYDASYSGCEDKVEREGFVWPVYNDWVWLTCP
ncbi:MAG: hypothetical protein ISR58_08885 [Anaerolineales bacterium]|nr:hypothetical protein [Chloroflexota bacterium]MBL6981293.1 hypothetical protein [Anaerolineales bacterium]